MKTIKGDFSLLRSTMCAGVAVAITAIMTWGFIASTATMQWPGSSTLMATAMTIGLSPTAPAV